MKQEQNPAIEFSRRIGEGDYKGAYRLFRRHPDLIAGMSREQLVTYYLELRNGGITEEQGMRFRNAVRSSLPVGTASKTYDLMELVDFLIGLKDRRE